MERRRDESEGDGFVVPKVECATPAMPSIDIVGDYLDGDDDQVGRGHWKSQTAPRTAGFVGHDASSRYDSNSSDTLTSSKPRERSNEWDQDGSPQGPAKAARRSNYAPNSSYSEDGRSSHNRSPVQRHTESHRMPYFRYFGPTAIVPGFKQMVVNVYRDRRKSRGSSFSTTSPGSFFGHGTSHNQLPHHETIVETLEDLPVYDVNAPGPAHPLITSLVDTFFHHLGCNYLFLRKERFVRMLNEKRIEPVLVDSVCALAARFSEQPIFTNEQDGKMKRSEYGHGFAQRARAAIVDTFPCPSVAAVQASLLMAYESFGANQDSALWMYLGIAIRMAVDLGLQKMEGVKYQGERDPWYTRSWSRKNTDEPDGPEAKQSEEETLSPEEQLEVEQERIDTFWAVFVLDRVISSGTGRPVTFRDGDYELSLPAPTVDPLSGWPAPFPTFIEIIHLYGRVSDVLNNIRNANDLTDAKMAKLARMEHDLTAMYQKQDERLHFNAVNFREYVNANQGTIFILLHFWFHALIIVLHQPTLLTPFHNLKPTQLLPNSRELSMSSAKTIADILAFAELIDPKSFVGNPFTSQPIYIAACAFLMESGANASQLPSREASPSLDTKGDHKPGAARYGPSNDTRHAKHSLLASAANQNYQRCYKSLQQLEQYWEGVGYILNALDQKSKGIWDCETYTNEDYEAIKLSRRGSFGRLPRFDHPASPNVPPIAYSLTGTTNSPNSNLTVLFQGNPTPSGSTAPPPLFPPPPPPPPSQPPLQPPSIPVSVATPPGNMIYDPIRQSIPEVSPAFPSYPQPNVSAVRHQSRSSKAGHVSRSPAIGKTPIKHEASPPSDIGAPSPSNDSKLHMHGHGGLSQSAHGPLHQPSYTPSSHHHSVYASSGVHEDSPSNTPTDSSMGQQHGPHTQHGQHGQHGQHSHNNHNSHVGGMDHSSGYEAGFAQSGLVSGSYSYMGLNPINDMITFNSQEVNFDMLGLQSEIQPPWLEILSGDILGGLFEGGITGGNHGHMG